jgi:hypothetical protein
MWPLIVLSVLALLGLPSGLASFVGMAGIGSSNNYIEGGLGSVVTQRNQVRSFRWLPTNLPSPLGGQMPTVHSCVRPPAALIHDMITRTIPSRCGAPIPPRKPGERWVSTGSNVATSPVPPLCTLHLHRPPWCLGRRSRPIRSHNAIWKKLLPRLQGARYL